MKKKGILAASVILLIALIIYSQKIYFPIEGTVIDAETGKPIEGAVVLAEWTITKGIGLTYTDIYRIVEAITDKSGRFDTKVYVMNPFINKPELTIYKGGYVCWNNKFIFPSFKHRENFKWKSNTTYELEQFKKEYSYKDHVIFLLGFLDTSVLVKNKDAFMRFLIFEESMADKEPRSRGQR